MFARKAGPRMTMKCQLYCYGILPFCILFWDHISFFKRNMFFLCCFEVRRCLAFHFLQNILIELQHAIKANQS